MRAPLPALINGCTIDWFLPWPAEALSEGDHLGTFEIADSSDADSRFDGEATKAQLVDHMAHAHQIVSAETAAYFERYRRNVYVTPRSYLAFVTSYTVMYRQKQSDVSELARKIKVGLAKLDEAHEDVAQMKVVLKEKRRRWRSRRRSGGVAAGHHGVDGEGGEEGRGGPAGTPRRRGGDHRRAEKRDEKESRRARARGGGLGACRSRATSGCSRTEDAAHPDHAALRLHDAAGRGVARRRGRDRQGALPDQEPWCTRSPR